MKNHHRIAAAAALLLVTAAAHAATLHWQDWVFSSSPLRAWLGRRRRA